MDRSKWEYKKLGEVAKFVGGGTPSKANEDYYTGNIPWATVRDMVNFNLSKTELCITDQAVKESATNIIPKDTIIISTHVGLGKICLLMQDTAINQDLKGVILPQSVDKMFFAAWYKSIADYIISNGKGATVKGVTMKFVNDLKIPIPPINDQQRIVAELDCLNEMIALKQEQLKEFDKLAQSIFYDMFGDPVTNEKGWDRIKLGDICTCITKGTTPTTVGFSFVEEGVNFVKVESFVDGKIDSTKLTHITYECNLALSRSQLESEDLLVCIAGATIGKMAFVDTSILPANTNQACAIIRLKDKKSLRFIHSFMALKLKNDIIQMGKGVAQPNLSLGQLRVFTVYLPPLALQQQFAEKIQAIEAQKELVKKSIAETQQLLASRMDYYFD